jgi:hypothetical protein
MIPTFFATILTLLTLTTFTAMSSNISVVEAVTNVDPDCAVIDQSPSGECDVTVDYDGDCNPNDANCNVNINVNANPLPTGNNELRLDYLLETGIECSNVAGGLAGKAACLTASQNEYRSNVAVTTGAGTISDNQFNFEGSQQVFNTAGQDNFAATNDMTQDVQVITSGTTSTVDTDGEGDNVQLNYLQHINEPDDTTNNNLGRQYVSLNAQSGGDIITSQHQELGFNLEQRLVDIDDFDTTPNTSPITATNRAHQILGIDATNNALINYDTAGLSTISQLIDDCSFSTTGTTTCTNEAGNPATTPSGQYTQLRADGTGTTINVDNLRQLINQKIDNFDNNDADANNEAALNTLASPQLFSAVASAGGDIDMAIADVTEQTQSLSQSITNSKESATNTATAQTINVGTDGNPINGLVEGDVDQVFTQSLSNVNTAPSSNLGTVVVTLFAEEGASQLFVEGFDQYLTQTATCSGCNNNGQVNAIFEVEDSSTFTIDGIQGLTQTATIDGASNVNTVSSTIRVFGDTEADINLDHQITNLNGNNNGNSQFTGSYTGGGSFNQNCIINTIGAFTQATSCS